PALAKGSVLWTDTRPGASRSLRAKTGLGRRRPPAASPPEPPNDEREARRPGQRPRQGVAPSSHVARAGIGWLRLAVTARLVGLGLGLGLGLRLGFGLRLALDLRASQRRGFVGEEAVGRQVLVEHGDIVQRA